MESASIQFVLYGLLFALLSRLSPAPGWRLAVLLAASALFLVLLGATVPTMLPLAGFLALGYGFVLLLRRGLAGAQVVGVALVILAFVWLKRYTILPAGLFLSFPYLTIGLSYIFFRVLHLVIEAARPGPARDVPLRHYLAYTLNFATLVSGPIQRYDDYLVQAEAPPAPLDAAALGEAVERIAIGFFKVNVLALLLDMAHVDALAAFAQPLPTGARMWALIRLVAAYPLFLYCNFSGYIDIVIAVARLMGLRLPENFDRPFAARSQLEFWTRWHMTLSNWLKTYVYNPLLAGLLRRNPVPALEPTIGVLCFFVTFFLIGVWHGRTSEYLVYGLLTGAGVAGNKVWQIWLARRLGRKGYKAAAARPAYGLFARGLSFTWFSLSLIWFWADWARIGTLFTTLPWVAGIAAWALLWLVASVALGTWEGMRMRLLAAPLPAAIVGSPAARTAMVAAIGLVAFLFVAVLSQPAPGIVYRTF